MQIWKFPLKAGQAVDFTVPDFKMLGPHFKPLSVQMQHGVPTLWALVNEDGSWTRRVRVALFGTGWNIPPYGKLEYIGTVQDGGDVWHAFLIPVDQD